MSTNLEIIIVVPQNSGGYDNCAKLTWESLPHNSYKDPQPTHKNAISPHNFGGQTHFEGSGRHFLRSRLGNPDTSSLFSGLFFLGAEDRSDPEAWNPEKLTGSGTKFMGRTT